MRFIRKGGRVIPIFEKGEKKPNKNEKLVKRGMKIQSAGSAVVIGSIGADVAHSVAKKKAFKMGTQAVYHAKAAHAAAKVAEDAGVGALGKLHPLYLQNKEIARGFAKASVAASKKAAKFGRLSNVSLALGLAGMIGGIAMSATGIKRERKRQGIK